MDVDVVYEVHHDLRTGTPSAVDYIFRANYMKLVYVYLFVPVLG
jgi:cAMP phosphodiesterase